MILNFLEKVFPYPVMRCAVIDLDKRKEIQDVYYADDEKGEYGIVLRDRDGKMLTNQKNDDAARVIKKGNIKIICLGDWRAHRDEVELHRMGIREAVKLLDHLLVREKGLIMPHREGDVMDLAYRFISKAARECGPVVLTTDTARELDARREKKVFKKPEGIAG